MTEESKSSRVSREELEKIEKLKDKGIDEFASNCEEKYLDLLGGHEPVTSIDMENLNLIIESLRVTISEDIRKSDYKYKTCGHCHFLQKHNDDSVKSEENYYCYGEPPFPVSMPGLDVMKRAMLSIQFVHPGLMPHHPACNLIIPRKDGTVIVTEDDTDKKDRIMQ